MIAVRTLELVMPTIRSLLLLLTVADSHLMYRLVTDPALSGSSTAAQRAVFGVRANSGTVFVSEPLDYETRQFYSLMLEVTDGTYK